MVVAGGAAVVWSGSVMLAAFLGLLLGVLLGWLLASRWPSHRWQPTTTTSATQKTWTWLADWPSDDEDTISLAGMPPPTEAETEAPGDPLPEQPEQAGHYRRHPDPPPEHHRPMPMPARDPDREEQAYLRGSKRWLGDRCFRIMQPPTRPDCQHEDLVLTASNDWAYSLRCPGCHMRMSMWWLSVAEKKLRKSILVDRARQLAREAA